MPVGGGALGALAIEMFAVPVMCLAVICGVVLLLVRLVRGGNAANAAMTQEEARIFQEMHHGMERLERRMEALETILLDSARSGDETGR